MIKQIMITQPADLIPLKEAEFFLVVSMMINLIVRIENNFAIRHAQKVTYFVSEKKGQRKINKESIG